MRVVPFSFSTLIRVVLALTFVVGPAVLLSNSNKPVFTALDKASHLDQATIDFLRPGLVVQITSAAIASDGTITARFTLTDPMTLPLDRNGITTPGPISTHFVVGTIPAGQEQYTNYITKQVVSGSTTATQTTSDSGGTYTTNAVGDYTYTFHTKAPAGFNPHATHSIGVWAERDLSEFNLTTLSDGDSNVYNFVPDGSAVTVTRDVVRTQACNKCHDPLSAHDDRRGVELCVMCHTPQMTDPATGNALDMKVFIHKIHMGSSLPSVIAGTPYQIVGYKGSVNDFSTVVFPADVRNCTVCHDQTVGAAQATAYLSKPTRAACGACHDDVNFATGKNHVNLPEIDDSQCAGCHIPQGELEFDASIIGAHTIPRFSKQLAGVVFTIQNVANGVAGKSPTVTFTLKDKSGNPIDISTMSRVGLTLAGPTTDYASAVSEDASKAAGSGGTYTYTFQAAVPAGATGSYAVEIEGERSSTINPGTEQAQTVAEAGANVVSYFSVDGSAVAPRRQVVSLTNCNTCHYSLSLHGDNRNQIEACVMCHNPNGLDTAFRKASQGPAQTIDFAHLIHRIHTGDSSTDPYTIIGYHGSTFDATTIRFPGDTRNCEKCHVNGSEQLPLPNGLLNVQDPAGVLNPMGPTAAACTGCHTDVATASHALSNTTTLGEACAVCHASDAEFAISTVHAR